MTSIINDAHGDAALVLSDGTVFVGKSVGTDGLASGLLVFNTDEFGYEAILTDPHYAGKIVVLTYPEIGNVGVNAQDIASTRGYAAALVVREMSPVVSNFRAERSLTDFLREKGIVAIAGIDTRALVCRLRKTGAQPGAVVAVEAGVLPSDAVNRAREAVESFTESGLVDSVTCKAPYEAKEGAWVLKGAEGVPAFEVPGKLEHRVVAIDLGIARDTLCDMVEAKMAVTVMPAKSGLKAILEKNPDGVFLSNGPGSAEALPEVVMLATELLAKGIPLFGVGLGAHVLALAAGAKVKSLRCGHYGTNHPVRDCEVGSIAMVKQDANHVVDEASLPEGVRVTHVSLFDGSVQGFTVGHAMGCQGAPQASEWKRFVSLMGGAK